MSKDKDTEWAELEANIKEKEAQGFKPMIIFVKEEEIPMFLKALKLLGAGIGGLDKTTEGMLDFYDDDKKGSIN
jgi:translation elongation factor EF-1beta